MTALDTYTHFDFAAGMHGTAESAWTWSLLPYFSHHRLRRQQFAFDFDEVPFPPSETLHETAEKLSEIIHGHLYAWQSRASDAALLKQVSDLSERLSSVATRVNRLERLLETRVGQFEPGLFDSVSEADWGGVVDKVHQVLDDLDWSAEVRLHPAELCVEITVPAQQMDLVVEHKFDFYERLASVLDSDLFRALSFEFNVEESPDS